MTGAAMPIKLVELTLDEIGYPGWSVSMRINPRSSVYDQLVQTDDLSGWWAAFGTVVIEWNFADEDGAAIPLPREVGAQKDLDLPINLLGFVLTRYFEAVRAAGAFPKASSDNSVPTSSTSEGSPRSA